MFKFMLFSLFALANLMVVAMVLFVFKIGGVVMTVSETHGVHSGDLLALPFAVMAVGSAFAAVRFARP